MRAAAELGLQTVALCTQDDENALHIRRADEVYVLPGKGVAGYIDIEAVIAAARATECDAIHPGYGFLSENAAFAEACQSLGLRFVGPTPALLQLFGDKARARRAARDAGVPVMEGTIDDTDLAGAKAFFKSLSGKPMLLKAVAGGGGRGIRLVRTEAELAEAFERCRSEARIAFGNASVYAEEMMERARHIEVQVAGDGTSVVHLHERECSIQRLRQKVVELAPAPFLSPDIKNKLCEAALRLARAVQYQNVGTIEFLVRSDGSFAFMEANSRIQVEHTVTEAVTGIDIVHLQFHLASGRTLADVGLSRQEEIRVQGYAIQLRVNAEHITEQGEVQPSGGRLTAFEPVSGLGVRTDTAAYAGYTINPRYDSLLAKVITHSPSPNFTGAVQRALRALAEFRIEGVETNRALLQAILEHPDFAQGATHTRWLDMQLQDGLTQADHPIWAKLRAQKSGLYFEGQEPAETARSNTVEEIPEGAVAIRAPMQGSVVAISAAQHGTVRAGETIFILDAMKLEHEILTPVAGAVMQLMVAVGDVVEKGDMLALIEEKAVEGMMVAQGADEEQGISPLLKAVLDRHARILDEARPDAVAKQRVRGERTARENVDDLFDAGSFVEIGPLVIPAQRSRRPLQDLIERAPADGVITGFGAVNSASFGAPTNQCAVIAYDYSVMAGTQGINGHRKTDRLIDVADKMRIPVVLFAQGGGGRPGESDMLVPIDPPTFNTFPRLSGLVPLIGIVSGPCFAGNAGLLGCCDVIIATRNSNIGMGGPAMVEGGGLGVFRTEDIGPIDVQTKCGVVDVAVADEAEAVQVAKQYLSYFQGPLAEWSCADQLALRTALPANRSRGYNVRRVIDLLADTNSVLELRKSYGIGIITSFIRIEGRSVGVLANNPLHLGGAVDADSAEKAVRFILLCDAFNIPILSLVDTPGMMVGPEAEKTGQVRRASRLFLAAANISVPLLTVVMRKCYGLGSVAMAAGYFKGPLMAVAWPTAEFGGMGLEASVKLGYRREMNAIADPDERAAYYQKMVDAEYEKGGGLNMSSHFWYDDAIDPADTRKWVVRYLQAQPPAVPRAGKKRPAVDA
jgi:acetyl/propionyl-CoA carboxylase alpha subunit